jgi:hypothetical protein
MNEDLTFGIPGTGYLSGLPLATNNIPRLKESQVSDVLWYACRFWAEHIIEVEGPVSQTFLNSLHQFLTKKLVTWVEVLNSRYPFRSLVGVRQWLQVSIWCINQERTCAN